MHEPSKWNIRMISLTRRRDLDTTFRDGLRAVEGLFADERLEVSARRNTVFWRLDAADVDAIS